MRAKRPPVTPGTSPNGAARRCLLALALLCLSGGCTARSYLTAGRLPYATLAIPYARTQLKASTTLDVLDLTNAPDYQFSPKAVSKTLLSQNDTKVALTGQSKDGWKTWSNLIVFDEHRMTARHKTFFCSDERAVRGPSGSGRPLIPPRRGVFFDGQFTLTPDIQTTPYATDEAKQIAIVRWLANETVNAVRDLTGGAGESAQPNELLATSGMMMNQVFQGVLLALARSPGLARNLADETGVEFPHISLGKGRIQMTVANDIVTVKIRVNLPMK